MEQPISGRENGGQYWRCHRLAGSCRNQNDRRPLLASRLSFIFSIGQSSLKIKTAVAGVVCSRQAPNACRSRIPSPHTAPTIAIQRLYYLQRLRRPVDLLPSQRSAEEHSKYFPNMTFPLLPKINIPANG
jgi:hypothetical protein